MHMYLQPFCEIMELTDVQEGIIVRCIQQLNEILRDVKNAAHLIGDPVLKQKMQEASDAIKRDIVFAASLYTSEDNPKLKQILEDTTDERLLPVGDEWNYEDPTDNALTVAANNCDIYSSHLVYKLWWQKLNTQYLWVKYSDVVLLCVCY